MHLIHGIPLILLLPAIAFLPGLHGTPTNGPAPSRPRFRRLNRPPSIRTTHHSPPPTGYTYPSAPPSGSPRTPLSTTPSPRERDGSPPSSAVSVSSTGSDSDEALSPYPVRSERQRSIPADLAAILKSRPPHPKTLKDVTERSERDLVFVEGIRKASEKMGECLLSKGVPTCYQLWITSTRPLINASKDDFASPTLELLSAPPTLPPHRHSDHPFPASIQNVYLYILQVLKICEGMLKSLDRLPEGGTINLLASPDALFHTILDVITYHHRSSQQDVREDPLLWQACTLLFQLISDIPEIGEDRRRVDQINIRSTGLRWSYASGIKEARTAVSHAEISGVYPPSAVSMEMHKHILSLLDTHATRHAVNPTLARATQSPDQSPLLSPSIQGSIDAMRRMDSPPPGEGDVINGHIDPHPLPGPMVRTLSEREAHQDAFVIARSLEPIWEATSAMWVGIVTAAVDRHFTGGGRESQRSFLITYRIIATLWARVLDVAREGRMALDQTGFMEIANWWASLRRYLQRRATESAAARDRPLACSVVWTAFTEGPLRQAPNSLSMDHRWINKSNPCQAFPFLTSLNTRREAGHAWKILFTLFQVPPLRLRHRHVRRGDAENRITILAEGEHAWVRDAHQALVHVVNAGRGHVGISLSSLLTQQLDREMARWLQEEGVRFDAQWWRKKNGFFGLQKQHPAKAWMEKARDIALSGKEDMIALYAPVYFTSFCNEEWIRRHETRNGKTRLRGPGPTIDVSYIARAFPSPVTVGGRTSERIDIAPFVRLVVDIWVAKRSWAPQDTPTSTQAYADRPHPLEGKGPFPPQGGRNPRTPLSAHLMEIKQQKSALLKAQDRMVEGVTKYMLRIKARASEDEVTDGSPSKRARH